MANETFSYEDAASPANQKPAATKPATFSYEEAMGESPARGLKGWAQDVAATAVKGAIAVPEAIVGLADIPTGGRVGKFLENRDGAVGLRFKEAKEAVNEWHSDATKEAQRKFQAADGIWDKAVTAVQNPSLIATAVGESIPSMLAGGVAARGIQAGAGLMGVGSKLSPTVAGAMGEGVTMAGSAAEQIRQETKDGLLNPTQAGLAAATGVVGGGFSVLGGKVAQKLGIGDAETMLAQGSKGMAKQFDDAAVAAAANPLLAQQAVKGIPRKAIEGAISEGFLEELPQSVAEQIFQNIALDKDWYQDVDAAMVMGVLSGGAMGAGAAAYHGYKQPHTAKPGQPDADPAAPPATDSQQPGGGPLLLGNQPPEQMVSFPDGTVGRTGEVESYLANLPEDQRAEARARLMGQSITEVNAPRKPSEEMGLRSGPDAGALESIAAMAVDNGAHGQMQQAAAQAQAQELAAEAGADAAPKAQPAAEAPSEQPRAQEQHAVDPDTGEISGMPTVSDWSDGQLSDAYRTAQEPEVRRQLAAELVRRRANREEEALQAELRDEQASAAMQHVPDSAFAGVREDAGEVPQNIEVQGGSNAAAEAASEVPAPGSKAQGANVATLMQLNRKQLPDMSEGELQQLASMLPAEHKRQAKIQAELLARSQQAQPAINQGATTDGTQTDQAEQGSAQPAQAGRAQAAQAVQPVAARADAGAGANPASAGASAASLGAGQADGAVQPAAGGRRNVGDQRAPRVASDVRQETQPGAEPAPQVRAGSGQGSNEQAGGADGQPASAVGVGGQDAGVRAGNVQQDTEQGLTNGTTPTQNLGAQAAPASGAQAQAPATQSQPAAAPVAAASTDTADAMTVGTTPKTGEQVSVRDGVVYLGRYEALDYDSGEPVTVPAGATRGQVAEALRKAGVLTDKQKVFGLKDRENEAFDAPAVSAQDAASAQATAAAAAKQQKAIDQINSPRGAVYYSKAKAEAFVADNGLGDSHEIERKGAAFIVRAKPAQDAAAVQDAPAPAEAAATAPEPVAPAPAASSISGKDLGNGWSAFDPASGTKGVPRAQMPQIKAEHRGAMANFMNARGVKHEEETVPADSLKPTQAEFSPEKVEKAKNFESGNRAILVSRDGHVLDGHHQWMAAREKGEDVRVIRLDAPIDDLVKLAHEFPSSTVADGATEAKPAQVEGGAQQQAEADSSEQPVVQAADQGDAAVAETAAAEQEDANADAPEPAPKAEQADSATDAAQPAPAPEAMQEPEAQAEPAKDEPAPAEPAEPAEAPAAISDFGEKIGGAKKDLWIGFKDGLREVSDKDIGAQPLSKVWPVPDYQKLIEAGHPPESVALIRSLRDEIPAKPRTAYKVTRWADQVKALREFAAELADGTLKASDVRRQMDGISSLKDVLGRADLYEAVGHEKSLDGITFAERHYSLYKGQSNVNLWMVESRPSGLGGWPKALATGKTKEEALAAFKAGWAKAGAADAAKAGTKFEIFVKRFKNQFFVGKKIGRNYAELAGPFATSREAREHRDANQQALEEKLSKYKEIPQERADTNRPRVGQDMRNAQDVTPQMFSETFGFRGVEFGNWVEQSRRQQDLNNAFDALMDMAAVLGISPKAVSLNGELGIAFGARGSGGKGAGAAHYEPGKVVINITKRSGAGSLGHEWWHALDNYFSRMRKEADGYLSTAKDVQRHSSGVDAPVSGEVRAEMVKAFGQVVSAINRTAMRERSQQLDGRRSKDYWTTGEELSARAFEAYLIAKLADQNAANDYLANVVSEQSWQALESLGFHNEASYPYPTIAEMPEIRGGFDHFFQTVEQRDEGDGKVALFSQGLVSPPPVGPKPSAQSIQRLVDRVQQLSKNKLPVTVVGGPSDVPGIEAPIGTNPSGALAGGRIYLFADNIRTIGEAYVTLFHEVFHLGLQKVIPAEDYAALLKDFARNPLVQKFMRQWKGSVEGRQRAAQMPSAAYEALAAEEALAMVSEELAADAGMGSRAPGLVKRMLSWFANVADRLGLPGSFGDWVRGLSRTQAEQFVSDMTRAVLGGELNLARTRAKYGTRIEVLSQQNRMRQGELATVADEADSGNNAANFEGTAKPRRPASAQDKAVMEAIASGKSARDVLRLVAGQSKDPFLRNVARMLLKSGITPNIEFGHIGKTKDGKPIHGQYRGKTDTIAMAGSAEYAAERIFMHEAMHAATMRALATRGLAKVQLLRLAEHVRKQPGMAGFYGTKDRKGSVDEFVAEVFTNPDFQAALRKISAPSGSSSIKTAWDGFVRILRSILGLPNDANNALSQALGLGVAALRQDMLLRKQGTESKGRANMATERAIAPVELTLKGWSGTASELSALAREVYSQELQGTTERNDSMGVEIAFTSEGKGEAFGARGKLRHPERAELVRVLRELVRDAVKVAEAPPGKGREVDSLAFHTLVAPLAINGQMHAVLLTVREARHTPKGAAAHKFYDVAQVKIERSPDADGVASSISAGPVHPGTVGTSSVSVSDLAQALKIDGYEAGGDDGADVANFGADDFTQIKNSAIDQLNAAFKHEGKVSVWDKTVGTMRNLAERAKAFKPVYETAQRTIDDVSMLANDAADMAPSLLPRVESLADLKKKPVSAEDNKAVAKPLFEGTLMWARDVDGTAVLSDDLIAKYAALTPDQKAELLVRAGKLNEGMLRAWRGMPAAQFAAAINSRFQNQLLKSGVVWSDDELKIKFKATPEQIRLYREARSAIDRSIDMTARADMLRLLGEDYAPMRDAVLDQPDMESAAKLLTDMLEQEAKDVPDKAERIGQLVQQLDKRLATAADLQARGYAPLSRFGRYTVDVVDKSGERLYFGMYESQRESNLAKLKLAQGFPGAKITQGTMSAEAYKLFAGMTPETAEQFGAMLGLNKDGDTAQDQAYQEYLKLAQNNHSALKRMIHRKGIAGYSEDVGRVIANFVYSNARAGSMGLNAGQLEKAIEAIPKEQGELRDVAVKLRDYIRDPQEEGQAIRGMLFAQYLGGSVASALVNMTQPFQITMPWLSQYGGMAKAGKQMAKALKDMGTKGFQYEADLAKALKAAEDDGTVSPQEVHQLMAQARGAGALRSGDGTKAGNARAAAANTWERTKVAWGQPFALAEQFNRRTTFIAAYRIAKDQGMADPAEFARKAVLETQFVYSKANKPRWARGAVGGTLFTFKTYSVSYLELMHRMWTQGGPEGKRAVGWAIAMLMLMSGAGGLPFLEDAEDLIDGAGQMMGYNISTKQWRKELLAGVVGKEMGEFMEQGISGLPGAPVDVSGRLGMGNLIPGTGLFLNKPNRERDLLEVAGPAGDLVKRGFTGARKALSGDVAGAAMEVSPTAVRNVAKGADMARTGMYRDTKGYKVIDSTLDEALFKAIGFQPKSVAEDSEASSYKQRTKSFYIQTSADIKAQWAQAVFTKDDAALERVRERLAAWNRNNPDLPITVKIPDIMKKVREMGKNREQRIADTAPKALRQQLREMAHDANR